MRPLRASLLLLTLPFFATGCGSLGVYVSGTLPAHAVASELTFNRHGAAFVRGQALHLDTRHELRYFGVSVANTEGLPLEWQSPNAPASDLVVAAVDKSSPLGIAGLAVYDRILEVNGEPADLLSVASALRTEDEVALRVVRPWGVEETIRAEASDDVLDRDNYYLPFLVETQSSTSGSSIGLGPFDGLFNYRRAVLIREGDDGGLEDAGFFREPLKVESIDLDRLASLDVARVQLERVLKELEAREAYISGLKKTPPSVWRDRNLRRAHARRAQIIAELRALEGRMIFDDRRVERFEWGCLFNLFLYQRTRDLVTGEEESRFRLFWILSFGDDDASEV